MKRIILIVLKLILGLPYYLFKMSDYGKHIDTQRQEGFAFMQRLTRKAVKAGRVTLDVKGEENIPEDSGFVYFPNHQGLFDVLVFLASSPKAFSFIYKKEVGNIILVKQVISCMGSIGIDRSDVRQGLQVINQMTEEIKQGRNFIIFAEGTRSKQGNITGQFKGGSFKSAVNAKAPIVPCALVDSFMPFDSHNVKPVTVKLRYLKPMYYEEYAGMKTPEIAAEVKRRIDEAIAAELNS